MARVKKRRVELIVGRSLLAGEALLSEFRRRLTRQIAEERFLLRPGQMIQLGRNLLDEFAPIYAQALTDADLAAWVDGVTAVLDRLPKLAMEAVESPEMAPPEFPSGPRESILGRVGADPPGEPLVRFPMIERAAERLAAKNIVTRAEFDELADNAKRRAFTVARQANEDVIDRIRDALTTTVEEGASLARFKRNLGDELERSFIGPGHLENVYRTNIQRQFHEGFDEMASNPVVQEVFPYQEYLPIHDGRTREEHRALEKLGLSGTNIYRRDDPFWDLFLPPWDYQCRCGVNLLTVEAAANRGVVEARKWLRTGIQPHPPEWRIEHIPFRPPPEFVSGRAA